MIRLPLVAIFLIQTSLAFIDESYPDNVDSYPELIDTDNDVEVDKRSSHFLRFGRDRSYNYQEFEPQKGANFLRYGRGNEDAYYARPTKAESREGIWNKKDYHIRLGRAMGDKHLRYGRTPQYYPGGHLRFGRSDTEADKSTNRSKREASSNARDSFVRYGKSIPYYQRYGRAPMNRHSNTDLVKMSQLEEPAVIHLLTQLTSQKQDDAPCTTAA